MGSSGLSPMPFQGLGSEVQSLRVLASAGCCYTYVSQFCCVLIIQMPVLGDIFGGKPEPWTLGSMFVFTFRSLDPRRALEVPGILTSVCSAP